MTGPTYARRGFLGRAGTAAVGGTAAAAMVPATASAQTPNRPVHAPADVTQQNKQWEGRRPLDLPDRARLGFFKGLLHQDEKPCIGLALGDSITEGTGLGAWTERYQYLLQGLLRRAHPGANESPGIGYLPAGWATGGYLAEAVTEHNAQLFTDAGGLGNRMRIVEAGDWITWPATNCDKIWVHYTRDTFFPGTFEVVVDDAVVATRQTAGEKSSGQILEVELGDGEHVVTVRGKPGTGGGSPIEGVSFFRGTGGLYLFDGSHAGYRADLYINRDQADLHWQAAAAINPSFITCMLGANDMAGNFDVPIPPEEWATNLAMLVDTALAACPNAGFYFFHWTERYEDFGNGRLQQFEQAAWEAIGSHTRVSFRVLSDLLPSGHDDSLGWHAFDGNDHVHPNALGHAYLADQLVGII